VPMVDGHRFLQLDVTQLNKIQCARCPQSVTRLVPSLLLLSLPNNFVSASQRDAEHFAAAELLIETS
jgi:hypothetical protein